MSEQAKDLNTPQCANEKADARENQYLVYKGYTARVEYSMEDGVFYGKLSSIKDLVNFESTRLEEIESEFYEAVDAYLQLCDELGENGIKKE